MPQVQQIPLDKILPNRLRSLDTYPWVEPKIASLMRSIESVGMWESIIGRPVDDKIEIAFGHHRVEAAGRLKLTTIPVIVKPMDGMMMLQYMGRENGDDYATDFLIMLNTWDACVKFLSNQKLGENSQQVAKKLHPIEIAEVLGWTRYDKNGTDKIRMNTTSEACANAHALITSNQMARDDFKGLTVRDAKEITQRTLTRIKQLEDVGHLSGRPKAEIEKAKAAVVKGAKITVDQVKRGELLKSKVANSIDSNAYDVVLESKIKVSPLFAVFSKNVANTISAYLYSDAVSDKLSEIIDQIPNLSTEADKQIVDRIKFELEQLSDRAQSNAKKITYAAEKVVKFTAIKGDR